MKALVTGGAGFIGSHLVERMLGLGYEVRVLDNFSTGKRSNLEPCARTPPGSTSSRPTSATPTCPEYRQKGATSSSTRPPSSRCRTRSITRPETHDVNLQGTLNVLEAARQARVGRVVFASLGGGLRRRARPAQARGECLPTPIAPYALEKLASEHYLAVFARLYGVETVALRYFNVFGPRQDPSSPYSGVISIFADRARRAEPLDYSSATAWSRSRNSSTWGTSSMPTSWRGRRRHLRARVQRGARREDDAARSGQDNRTGRRAEDEVKHGRFAPGTSPSRSRTSRGPAAARLRAQGRRGGRAAKAAPLRRRRRPLDSPSRPDLPTRRRVPDGGGGRAPDLDGVLLLSHEQGREGSVGGGDRAA